MTDNHDEFRKQMILAKKRVDANQYQRGRLQDMIRQLIAQLQSTHHPNVRRTRVNLGARPEWTVVKYYATKGPIHLYVHERIINDVRDEIEQIEKLSKRNKTLLRQFKSLLKSETQAANNYFRN